MRLDPGYTKLTQKDIEGLNQASENLASAAAVIQQLRPQWGPAVVRLLVEANDVCVRIMTRGAASIARYIEKQQALKLAEAAEAPAAAPKTTQESPIEPQPE